MLPDISLILEKHTLIESILQFAAAWAQWNDWNHSDVLTYGAEQAAACSEQIQPCLLKQYRRNIELLHQEQRSGFIILYISTHISTLCLLMIIAYFAFLLLTRPLCGRGLNFYLFVNAFIHAFIAWTLLI